MSAPNVAGTRYSHVDSLRGIAALLVIWLHVTEVFHRLPNVRMQGEGLYLIARMLDPGRVGVVIFFAISGFVICSSLKGPALMASRDFLIKRCFRLFPAYWLAIVLGSLAVWKLSGKPLSTELYAANATMIPTLFGFKNMMGLLWTLETELVFYVLCLLLFWCGILHRPVALTLNCFALLALFAAFKLKLIPAPDISTWRSMPYHLAIMFWGGIARHCYDDPKRGVNIAGFNLRVQHLLALVAAAIVVPLAVIATVLWMSTGESKELVLTIAYSLGMTIFVIGVFFIRLQHRTLVWLGAISYSIYLFHPIFFVPMYVWSRHHQQHPLASMHMSVYLALTVALTLAFSHLVYNYLESPSNRLARNWVSRLRTRTGASTHG